MSYLGSLVSNPHEGVAFPAAGKAEDVVIVKGVYDYFHYKCDGFNDVGWGCGYRTLQTMCSWILRLHKNLDAQNSVPSIPSIQQILVDIEDKPAEFMGSRDWIGSFEVGYVLSTHYNIDFKILHVTASNDWKSIVHQLSKHFREGGCPVMMGGKTDAASKCIIGTCKDTHLLVLDPHLTGRASENRKLVSWHPIEDFDVKGSNFYNLCIPLIKWES